MSVKLDVLDVWNEWRLTDSTHAIVGTGDEMATEIRRLREQLRVAREALESIHGKLAPEGFLTRWKNEGDAAVFAWVRARVALAQLAEPTEVDHG